MFSFKQPRNAGDECGWVFVPVIEEIPAVALAVVGFDAGLGFGLAGPAQSEVAASAAVVNACDADLDAAWTKARSKNGPQWVPYFEALRAVAALVRKDDEALIRQMLEALETCSDSGYYPYSYDEELVEAAAAAARARLAPTPPTA